jgi:hypothetical protein
MAFFQKNIGNFLHRLTVFCIFSFIRFNRWGPWVLKHKAWDQICSLFPGKNAEHIHNAQRIHNGEQEEQVQGPWPCFSWPIIDPRADVGHFEGLNQGDQSCILPIHQGFFGADDTSQVWSNQGETLQFYPKNAECLGCAQVCHHQTPADDLSCHQETGDVFGILRDQIPCVCAVVQQKRLRTSWYL